MEANVIYNVSTILRAVHLLAITGAPSEPSILRTREHWATLREAVHLVILERDEAARVILYGGRQNGGTKMLAYGSTMASLALSQVCQAGCPYGVLT